MKVISKITTGHRTDGKSDPLVREGEWDFEGRRLTTQERALVYALRDAKLLEIVEDDPPADVVSIETARARRPRPEDFVPAPVASTRRRAKKRRVSRG